MSYPCPKCNDHGTQSVPMLYESGTRRASKGGSSQSDLAARLAPPQKRRVWPRLLLLLVMPAAGVAITDIFGSVLAPLLILSLVAAIFSWALMGPSRYNKTVWAGEMQEWRSLWICKACGQLFKPQAPEAAR